MKRFTEDNDNFSLITKKAIESMEGILTHIFTGRLFNSKWGIRGLDNSVSFVSM